MGKLTIWIDEDTLLTDEAEQGDTYESENQGI